MLAAGGSLGVIYLGANLPAEEILRAVEHNTPRAVVLGLTGGAGNARRLAQVRKILKGLPGESELWLGGPEVARAFSSIKSTRLILMEDFETLERHLQRLGGRLL
jgi:methylmalonyl-CoA mutase cobalamin-binding subunit